MKKLFGSSSIPFLYQVNLLETLHKEIDTVSLTVGTDLTIGLRRESRQIDDENDDDENVLWNYYINNDLHIQFGREEFCLVTGLRFGVENREEYDTQANLPFRRRVFPSHLDGQPIMGIDIVNAIDGPTFAELYDDNVVGLCCLGILQLVLLGAESRRNVLEWLLRTANDRGPPYVDQPTNEDDPTTYSIFGYTWAFKENIPATRLTPDDNEARSDWWISSKAYFDGFIDQVEQVPFDLSRQNMYEIPSDIYQQFVEQKIKLERNKKDVDDIKEEMLKFKEEMNGRPVRQENTVPITVGQHYGFSDFSQFQSMQGGLSSFKGHANSSFFNMGTPSNFQTPMRSQPGSSDWQRQMSEQPNLQTTIETQLDVDGIVDQEILFLGFDEEEVQKISTSIFVTNFLDYAKAKDLWNVCKQYDQVVDAFISDRKSKAGKRYGSVRFIRVYDVDRLVSNLCTLWMGSHHLHAHVARFMRPPAVKSGGYTH
nr:ChaC-like family protein [Tanacetum cinerariifolium]